MPLCSVVTAVMGTQHAYTLTDPVPGVLMHLHKCHQRVFLQFSESKPELQARTPISAFHTHLTKTTIPRKLAALIKTILG